MKVLHLYSGNLYGGIETYLVTLARFRHLGPEMVPHFGLCFPGRLRDELTAAGVPVHDLGQVRISRPWTILLARRRLKRLLAAQRFDLVVAHTGWPHAVFAPVVRRAGVRFVHAVHSVVDRTHWLNRWAARTPPDLILANSRFIAGSAERWIPGTPVRTCYLPVAPAEQTHAATLRRQVRAELGTRPDTVVILQASRLESWKGQHVHLQALAKLKDHPNWEAWIAGGAQRAGEAEFLCELKSQADRAGVAQRVKFLGQRSDVPSLMAAADILCQPNTGPEPFGIAFVEALSAGLPVVTSNFGGGAELVDDTCGVLTPPGDATAVAEALAGLIGDPSRRATLGRRGPERTRRLCDPAARIAELTTLLAEVSR